MSNLVVVQGIPTEASRSQLSSNLRLGREYGEVRSAKELQAPEVSLPRAGPAEAALAYSSR